MLTNKIIEEIDKEVENPGLVALRVQAELEGKFSNYEIACFVALTLKSFSLQGLFPEREASLIAACFYRVHYESQIRKEVVEKMKKPILEFIEK